MPFRPAWGHDVLSGTEPAERLRQRVREIVAETAPDQSVNVTDDSDLIADLGYHSLALIELVFAIEDAFECPPIDDEAIVGVKTVGDIADHLIAWLAQNASEMGGQ